MKVNVLVVNLIGPKFLTAILTLHVDVDAALGCCGQNFFTSTVVRRLLTPTGSE